MPISSDGKRATFYYGGFAARAGGAFMHTIALSEGLRARGWSVRTVTLDNLPWPLRYLPHVVAAVLNRLVPPLGFYYKGLITGALFRTLIKRRKDELLVFEDIYLAWNSNNPSMTMLHAVWSDNLQSFDYSTVEVNRLKTKEIRQIKDIAHSVITVSKPYLEYLTSNHFRDFPAITPEVIELGLDTTKFERPAITAPISSGRRLIYCGALEARKNIGFMLEVFARIYAQDPTSSLTIIGDGPDRAALEQYSRQLGLDVIFLGRLRNDEVLRELKKHNIYIHTALKESFSFALLEAKLSGLTTCALANLEIPAEFIDLGFDGFDVDDWSARIMAISSQPDLRDFPDYSIERMTDRTLVLVVGH